MAGWGGSEGGSGCMVGGPVEPRGGASLRVWLAEELGLWKKLVEQGIDGVPVRCGNGVLREKNEELAKSRMCGRQAETRRCRERDPRPASFPRHIGLLRFPTQSARRRDSAPALPTTSRGPARDANSEWLPFCSPTSFSIACLRACPLVSSGQLLHRPSPPVLIPPLPQPRSVRIYVAPGLLVCRRTLHRARR